VKSYLLKVVGGLTLIIALSLLIGSSSPHEEMRNLPAFTVSTVTRITITLAISIAWGVSFGILAATSRTADYIITPIVDLLQSIPILGYFPLVIGFLFSWGAFGIEISVILLLFTSMAWAIFFSVLSGVKSIPANVIDASKSFGISGWRYTRNVILPAVAPAVVAGANLAWSDGWFFMIAAEYIEYKGNIVAPASGGLGFLLARATYFYQDMNMAIQLLIFVTVLVLVINSLTWHKIMERANTGTFKPIIQLGLQSPKQRGAVHMSEWFSFKQLEMPAAFSAFIKRLEEYSRKQKLLVITIMVTVLFLLVSRELDHVPSIAVIMDALVQPPGSDLANLPMLILLTMGRLTIAYAVSLVVAIGLGVLAAENKTAAAVIYPIYDIGQGVPILALFPVIYLGLGNLVGNQRIALEITCIVMLVLDMIWYMFISITSAVRNIPSEIKEVGAIFGFKGIKRVTHIVIPSILPAIVTGSILSWGTGWNTVIFSEYLQSTQPGVPDVYVPGLGSLLDKAGYIYGNTVILVLVIMIISIIVIGMEALIWRRLLRRFEKYQVEVQ
jgi:NitT/TauT family transport system permease protein